MKAEQPLQAGTPRRLSDFIRDRHEQILADWEATVRRMRPAQGLERPVLLDHMPEFLAELASFISEVRAGHDVPVPGEQPRIHALERLELGFDLAEVVSEYAALRDAISNLVVRESAASMRSAELPRLHNAIDQAIATSVVRYQQARERTLQALDRISTAAMAGEMNHDFLTQILNALLETTAAVDSVSLLLLEPPDVLRVAAAVGLGTNGGRGDVTRVGVGLAGRVAKEREPIFWRDASNDPTVVMSSFRKSGTHALYGVPLLLSGELLGVVMMGSRSTYEFSQEDQLLLRTMAHRATGLLAQARLRDELRKSELQMRLAVTATGLGTWDWDLRKNDLFWSDAAKELLGLRPEQAMSADVFYGRVHPDDRAEVINAVKAAFAKGSDGRFLVQYRGNPDALEGRWYESQGRCSFDEAGDPVRFSGTLLDISQRKAQELSMQRDAELRERLIGIVSHDLRNPLHVVGMAAFAIARDPLTERQKSSLQRLRSSTVRAERLIRDLLDYSSAAASGGIPINRRPMNLAAVVQTVVDDARTSHPGREISLSTPSDVPGDWDADRLQQVVGNLLGNALQHSPPGTPVRLAVERSPLEERLTVANEGLPIPPDELPRLFEPFRRGGRAKQGHGSVGLGLYIASEIARAHGGRLEAQSDAAGTRFTLVLPQRGEQGSA